MLGQRAGDNARRVRVLRAGRRPGRAGLRRRLASSSTTTGAVIARAPQFTEHLLVATSTPSAAARGAPARHAPAPGAARRAAPEVAHLGALHRRSRPRRRPRARRRGRRAARRRRRGLRARSCSARATTSRKNGFEHVVLGLSGGIDSTLVATVAVDALGAEKRHRGDHALALLLGGHPGDARALAEQPRHRVLELPIARADGASTTDCSARSSTAASPDITEENLQARIRGNLLMALSNKFGWLVLTTGNKSEMSVGYSTLYGDSAGGFAVIKDVPKLLVYQLVDIRATRDAQSPIPRLIVDPPAVGRAAPRPEGRRLAAALRDPRPRSCSATSRRTSAASSSIARGLPAEDVDRVIRLVDLAEYKRRQAPPGIKITSQGLRPRPPRADHQPLPRLSGVLPHGDRHPHERAQALLVVGDLDLQTHVVRPRWRRARHGVDRAAEDRAQERGLVGEALGRLARRPATANQVAIEVIDSAIEAKTPPWTRPTGCLSSSVTSTWARTSRRRGRRRP